MLRFVAALGSARTAFSHQFSEFLSMLASGVSLSLEGLDLLEEFVKIREVLIHSFSDAFEIGFNVAGRQASEYAEKRGIAKQDWDCSGERVHDRFLLGG
jgi:hypothetical protein